MISCPDGNASRDLVTLTASQGLSENESGYARISIMAKSKNALLTGWIQKRNTNPSVLISGVQHTAGTVTQSS